MGNLIKKVKKKPLSPLDTAPMEPPQISSKKDNIETLKVLTRGKASVYAAHVDAVVRSKRVQLTFSNVPSMIADEFKSRAAKADMGPKEYLYHLLREDGADIPQYSELDARRRVDK